MTAQATASRHSAHRPKAASYDADEYNLVPVRHDLVEPATCCDFCGHELTTGEATILLTPGGRERPAGPRCAKTHGIAGAGPVPNLTRGVSHAKPQRALALPDACDDADADTVMERGHGNLDIEYLLLRTRKLPALGFIEDDLPEPLAKAAEAYKLNRQTVPLTEVRFLRDLNQGRDHRYNLETMQNCYAAAMRIDLLLGSESLEDKSLLSDWRRELVKSYFLPVEIIDQLNVLSESAGLLKLKPHGDPKIEMKPSLLPDDPVRADRRRTLSINPAGLKLPGGIDWCPPL